MYSSYLTHENLEIHEVIDHEIISQHIMKSGCLKIAMKIFEFMVSHQGCWNQHFISQAGVYSYSIVLIVLIVFVLNALTLLVCKVRILVRPWPDLPGWFLQPWP